MELLRVASDELQHWCVRKLTSVGVPEDHAKITADVLVQANLRGVDSHGVLRVEHYIKKIAAGGINPVPKIGVNRTGPVTAIVDGDDGLGHVVACRAMETALDLAEEHGVGVVGAVNSSHCGALSYFVEMATKRNMIGVVMSNTDKGAVPHGGREPFFGTNPMAFGFPSRRHPPIILDMATTTVAFGKILDHKLKGKPIPPDWGVDREGESVTDPDKVYAMRHFGGAKGYGLALVVDVLSSVLFGGAFGPHVEKMYAEDLSRKRKLAQFFMALNPAFFTETDAFLDTMDRMIDEIHAAPPARGFDRVLVPGEPENLTKEQRLKEGIPLPEDLVRYLRGH